MWEYNNFDELYHYGIPGMKWGHRKKLPVWTIASNVSRTKAEYKQAKKQYNKDWRKYDTRRLGAYSPFKKGRDANSARFEKAIKSGIKADKAKLAYKKAKTARKEAIIKTYEKINKKTSFAERMLLNEATRKRAAKYVVDNNMSMKEASKKAKGEAIRNTGIILAAMGGAYLIEKKLRD